MVSNTSLGYNTGRQFQEKVRKMREADKKNAKKNMRIGDEESEDSFDEDEYLEEERNGKVTEEDYQRKLEELFKPEEEDDDFVLTLD